MPTRPLYTPDQRARRDASAWTVVQGVLAPIQFVAFAVSLALVLRCLATGEGYALATVSVLVKTVLLYAIMATGAAWERAVFGRWLFADAFWWEDAVSIGVLGLHTLYLAGLVAGWGPRTLMGVALAAYASYLVNAAQYLLKFRAARLSAPMPETRPEIGTVPA